MAPDDQNITYFAETDFRNQNQRFGIRASDRTRHVYIVGKTGMGKSTMIENMAVQDIQNGNGIAIIDPHGQSAEKLLSYVPGHRVKDVLYFAPFDLEHPVSFNVMEDIGADKRHLVVSGLMSAFKKLFGEESFSDRMQYILQNTILALLEYPGATMLGINQMLADKKYRNKVIDNITDPSVRAYWTKEYAGYTERFAAEAIPAIQNKIGQFTSNPLIRNIIGQPKSSFDIRKIIDEKKIMIINLSKGRVGEGNANLLGSMLITKIYLGAMSRADVSNTELEKLPNFYFYVDEFQSFANESFANILSEARKYKLNLTIAHQYIEQMTEEVRAAVFGNVGTMITFRVGAYDAEYLEKELAPTFTAEDLVNLGFAQIYLKLMVNGITSKPFSAHTLGPIVPPESSLKDEIIESSRKLFAQPRAEVEQGIIESHKDTDSPSQSDGARQGSQKGQGNKGSSDRRSSGGSTQPQQRERGRSPLGQKQNKSFDKRHTQGVSDSTDKGEKRNIERENRVDIGRKEQEQPFKTSQNEPELKKALSLSHLKNREKKDVEKRKNENVKKVSQENISDLKKALNEVLQEAGSNQNNNQSAQKPVSQVEKKDEEKKESSQKEKTKEIPENILRDILKVD